MSFLQLRVKQIGRTGVGPIPRVGHISCRGATSRPILYWGRVEPRRGPKRHRIVAADQYLSDCKQVFDRCREVLDDGGACAVVFGESTDRMPMREQFEKVLMSCPGRVRWTCGCRWRSGLLCGLSRHWRLLLPAPWCRVSDRRTSAHSFRAGDGFGDLGRGVRLASATGSARPR